MVLSSLIDRLANPMERSVLRFYYLNSLEIWEVAEKINKSDVTVYRIKQAAIKNLAEVR